MGTQSTWGSEGTQSVCDPRSCDGRFPPMLASFLPVVPDSYNVWEGLPLSGLSGSNTLLDRLFQLDAQPGDLRNDEQRLQARLHRHLEEALLLLPIRPEGQRLLNFQQMPKENYTILDPTLVKE